MNHTACETPGWQFIAGLGFTPRLDSPSSSMHTSRLSCQPLIPCTCDIKIVHGKDFCSFIYLFLCKSFALLRLYRDTSQLHFQSFIFHIYICENCTNFTFCFLPKCLSIWNNGFNNTTLYYGIIFRLELTAHLPTGRRGIIWSKRPERS